MTIGDHYDYLVFISEFHRVAIHEVANFLAGGAGERNLLAGHPGNGVPDIPGGKTARRAQFIGRGIKLIDVPSSRLRVDNNYSRAVNSIRNPKHLEELILAGKLTGAIAGEAGRQSNAELSRSRSSRAGRPGRGEMERRRISVLDTARDLYLQQGYAMTSVLDIARATGVAPQTISLHIGSKEDIFREVLLRSLGDRPSRPSPLPASCSVPQALSHMAQYICDICFGQESAESTPLLIIGSVHFPDFVGELNQVIVARFLSCVKEMFVELERRTCGCRFDPETAARLLVDLLLGTTTAEFYFGKPPSMPDAPLIEAKLDLFREGAFPKQIMSGSVSTNFIGASN